MKKLIFAVFCFLFFNYGHSQSVACSDFNISVGYGPLSVSTTVYVCCGGPFADFRGPCSVVSKKMYEICTQQSHTASTAAANKGIKVSELITDKNVDVSKLEFIEVVNSNKSKIGDNTISIKKGKYPIDKDGYVYLELESF